MEGRDIFVEVDLGRRSYPIRIGPDAAEGVLETAGNLARENRRSAFIVDEGFAAAHRGFLQSLQAVGYVLLLPAGETTKSLSRLSEIYDFLAGLKFDRSCCLFAVGGGVIGDISGFAAASYLRGIDFYQVPTTLLSMVDSSVGGKTGINLPAGKNLVGAFLQPQAVFSSTRFLETLPRRVFNCGMAETIKHGLLGDASLFEWLEYLDKVHAGHVELPSIIRRNCEIKAAVVGADEREKADRGGRALLNLGHTFAHAIENAAGYGDYEHGEAVGLGLVLAGELSHRLGNIDRAALVRIRSLVGRYQLPVQFRKPVAVGKVVEAMLRDKKIRRGQLRFVVLKRIGEACMKSRIDPALVKQILAQYGASPHISQNS